MPELAIEEIRQDGGTQPRSSIDQFTVAEYADAMDRGDTFPPVKVMYDGEDYWLYDGFHRVAAAEKAGRQEVRAKIEQGTKEDAQWSSLAANKKHGLQRDQQDKRRAIKRALKGWGEEKSQREIAEHVGVSTSTVNRLTDTCSNRTPDQKVTGKDGKEYPAKQDTSNIGGDGASPTAEEASSATQQAEELGHGVVRCGKCGNAYDGAEAEFCPYCTKSRDERRAYLEGKEAASTEEPETPNLDKGIIEMVKDTHVPDEPSEQRELAKLSKEDQRKVAQRVALNGMRVKDARRELRREEADARSRELENKAANVPDGRYQCIVIDPPWPTEKIERDERPNQAGFDYPTMSEDELAEFPVPDMAHEDCHLYLWTTHKYLPIAMRLAEEWGFNYQCLMTWCKNVGFTPFSWMYSTEHVLFCRRGSLKLKKRGLRLDFEAEVREHSRKPEVFYERVRKASPGPRIDVFSREEHEGFNQFGNETQKFEG